jgi:nitrate reductase (cytochrome), electron transfer subunit
MKITLSAVLCLLGAALAWAAPPLPSGPVVDPMRGTAPIPESTKPPLLGNPDNKDLRRTRAYSMQPPTIPHKTDGYQVDLAANRCLMCHSRARAEEAQAIPVGVTHYMDRDGNVRADVSPRRYFCEQCHVVQMDLPPLVPNTFEDVDTVLRRGAANAKAAKK